MASRVNTALVAFVLLLSACEEPKALNSAKITRDAVQEMFDRIKTSGDWDIEGRCVWGFFFNDPDKNKLEMAAIELVNQDYRHVGYLNPDDRADYWILHVERIESHTVDSLLRRNEVLYAIAEKYELASYDGMDVGPLENGDCG